MLTDWKAQVFNLLIVQKQTFPPRAKQSRRHLNIISLQSILSSTLPLRERQKSLYEEEVVIRLIN